MEEKETLVLTGKKMMTDRLALALALASLTGLVLLFFTVRSLITFLTPSGLQTPLFPTVTLVLTASCGLVVFALLFVQARRHFIVTEQALHVNQTGFAEERFAHDDIASVIARGHDVIIILHDGTQARFTGLKNGLACAKQAMVLKKARDAKEETVV